MRKHIGTLFLVMVFGAVVLWTGCGGQIPEWFLNTPQDPDYVYATGMSQSSEPERAIQRANMEARMEIARQVSYKVQEVVTKTGSSAETTTSMNTSATVVSAKPVSKKLIEKESNYQAYVLVRITIEEMKFSIVATVEADEELHAKLKDSPEFKKLVKEVEEYRKKKTEKKSTSG